MVPASATPPPTRRFYGSAPRHASHARDHLWPSLWSLLLLERLSLSPQATTRSLNRVGSPRTRRQTQTAAVNAQAVLLIEYGFGPCSALPLVDSTAPRPAPRPMPATAFGRRSGLYSSHPIEPAPSLPPVTPLLKLPLAPDTSSFATPDVHGLGAAAELYWEMTKVPPAEV